MTPTLAVAILASVVSLGAVWPHLRNALGGGRPVTEPSVSGTAFVAFALWTIYGALLDRPALVAASAVCLAITTLALSARALFGTPPPVRRSSASRA